MKKLLHMTFISLITAVLLAGYSISSTSIKPGIQTTGGVNKLAVTQGKAISVEGLYTNFALASVDFINASTGWLVRNNSNTAANHSQILMTHNGGTSWQTISVFKNSAVKELKFVNTTTGWALLQDSSQSNLNAQKTTMKILYTKDGGQNWNVQWEGKVSLAYNHQLWFGNSMRGYALVGKTLLKTEDGGENWSQVAINLNGFILQHMCFINMYTGWVIGVIEQHVSADATGHNSSYQLVVLHTTDGCREWQQQFTRKYAKGDGPIGSIDIDFVNASTGWFLTSDLWSWEGDLYYTNNAGKDWQKINQIKCVRPAPTEVHFLTAKIGWIPLEQGAGPVPGGLMYTEDGGKNFARVGNENEIDGVKEVDFISKQKGWAIGIDDISQGHYLVHTTDGGKTWSQVYPKLSPTEDISFVNAQQGFGLGELSNYGALLSTTDGGETWQQIYDFGKQYLPCKLSFVNRNVGWILATSLYQTVILQTTDGGHTWVNLNGDIPQISSEQYFHFFDVANGMIVAENANTAAINYEYYFTDNGGKSWYKTTQKRAVKTSNLLSFSSVNRGWEISTAGLEQNSISLSRMTLESNWRDLGQISTDAWPCGIDFISQNDGYLLIQKLPFKPDSLFELLGTTDGGKTWTAHLFPTGFRISTQIDHTPIQFIDSLHGWILSTKGLLRTQDGGRIWSWE
jgi:photosystem II stability/assembly factor-like uncharacterized protein